MLIFLNLYYQGSQETRRQDIIKILQQRFGTLPENLITKVNQIDDMSLLEDLILQTISVNCVEEFEARID